MDGDETPPAPTASHRTKGQGRGHCVGPYKTMTVAWPNVARAPPADDPRIYVSLKLDGLLIMGGWLTDLAAVRSCDLIMHTYVCVRESVDRV